MLRRFKANYLIFLHLSDTLMVIGALLIASALRIRLGIGASGGSEAFDTPAALFGITSVIWWLAFQLSKVYSPLHSELLWQELQRVVIGHGLACLLFFGVLYITYRDYSRLQAFYFIGLLLVEVVAHRVVIRAAYRWRGGRIDRRRVLIVGTDTNARRAGATVLRYAWAGLQLVGYVDPHSEKANVAGADDLNCLGSVDKLPDLVEYYGVDEVIVAVQWPDADFPNHVIQLLQRYVVNIRLAPDYSELAYFHVSVENFAGIPLIALRDEVLSPSQRLIKRGFDLVFSAAVLLCCWPLMLLIAVAIRLDSRGPILLQQQRAGEYGRLFTMFKFRSMYIDAEQPSASPSDHKQRHDPRVTRIGRFIRRTSLDELPQFFNVLRGEMSLVGPRPEMPWLVDSYEPWQRKRFEVPQGLTGWWQISGRADRPMHLNTEDDLFYIRHYSLWLDFQIIFRTILVVVMGRGAY